MSVWPLNFIKIFSVPLCRTIVTIKLSFLKKSFGSHQFWNQIDSGARAPVPYFGFRKCRVWCILKWLMKMTKSFEPLTIFAEIWLSPSFCVKMTKSHEPLAIFVKMTKSHEPLAIFVKMTKSHEPLAIFAKITKSHEPLTIFAKIWLSPGLGKQGIAQRLLVWGVPWKKFHWGIAQQVAVWGVPWKKFHWGIALRNPH